MTPEIPARQPPATWRFNVRYAIPRYTSVKTPKSGA
jgi:hypothetical protein